MKTLLCALLSVAAFAQKSAPDLCVPPPSGTAPALPAHIMTGQGTESINFKITTSSPEAQKFFNQGIAQLHSFWAVEAERSFLQAAEFDPTAPMPWFGVAMVASGDYRPRFQLDQAIEIGRGATGPNKRVHDAAEKALSLAEVPGKATDVEKMYIAAIVARRTAKNADDAYIDGLRAIIAKYPHEVEAKLYLALHLMRGYELPSHTPRGTSMEAVALLKELLVEAPEHPGTHHYIIHGYEGSTFAKDAWPSCKRYAELVPNIPHALHMPGHIYSITGRMSDAEKSFGDAAANELGYIHADALYGTGHHGHNVQYLSTAYAFDGKYDKAEEAARSLLTFKENPREAAQIDNSTTAYRQGWFALMRTLVLAEAWDRILDGQTIPVYDRPREQAWLHWAMGVAQAAKGNAAAASEEAKQMDAFFKQYEEQMKRKPSAELLVARQELDGHILAAENKIDQAMKTLKSASNAQRKLRYSEPPLYPRPVNEALGEIAMRHGKPVEAEAAFRTTLEDLPGSVRSIHGLQQAQSKSTGAAAPQ